MEKVYDIIIIGGGPAGLAAAIYAGRAKLSCLVLEAESEGGQIISTSEIENYPGCMPDESGQSLVSRMIEQAELFGAEFARDQVISVDLAAQPKSITGFAKDYNAKAVIIDGIEYPSIKEGAQAINGRTECLSKVLLAGKNKYKGHICSYANPQPSQENINNSILEGSTTNE